MRIVLASASPRRAALLREAGYDFEVRPSGVEEWPYPGGDPAGYAEALARAKAAGGRPGEVVVGADTIVLVDGSVLGKPASPVDAAAMLRRLSARTHEVITAVAAARGASIRSGHARALVTFRPLEGHEIDAYVASGEPFDKAGGYAYQGGARHFVTAVDGDADTVIGLPMRLLADLLLDQTRSGGQQS